MWGGTPDRNMVSNMKGLPTDWDVKTKKNVKWVADLGSQSYGNPGRRRRHGLRRHQQRRHCAIPKQPGDRGVLMAFRESDGEFLWQQTHEKLPSGRANDWPYQGVCSSPLVEGDRALLRQQPRRGLVPRHQRLPRRQERRPVTDEKLTGRRRRRDLDVRHDGGGRLVPAQHVELVAGHLRRSDLRQHVERPGREPRPHPVAARRPSIIAINKKTGKLVWEDNSVGDRILHGQWSHAVGRQDRRRRCRWSSAQGDGWVRGYEALTGKKLWEFDTNPKDSVWPKTRNEVIGTPVIYEDKVYIANGQDPEHGEGVGHLYAIDATKRGDITQTGRVWHYDKIRRSISTGADRRRPAVLLPTSAASCTASTRRPASRTGRTTCSRPSGARRMVVDGKVYLGDEDGDVVVLEAGKEKKVIGRNEHGQRRLRDAGAGHTARCSSCNRNQLFALAEK